MCAYVVTTITRLYKYGSEETKKIGNYWSEVLNLSNSRGDDCCVLGTGSKKCVMCKWILLSSSNNFRRIQYILDYNNYIKYILE